MRFIGMFLAMLVMLTAAMIAFFSSTYTSVEEATNQITCRNSFETLSLYKNISQKLSLPEPEKNPITCLEGKLPDPTPWINVTSARSPFEEAGFELLWSSYEQKKTVPPKPLNQTNSVYQMGFIEAEVKKSAVWAITEICESFGFGHKGYTKHFQQTAVNYSVEGYDAFKKAIEEAGLMDFVSTNEYILQAGIGSQTPVQVRADTEDDSLLIGFPMIIGFGAEQITNQQSLWVTAKVNTDINAPEVC